MKRLKDFKGFLNESIFPTDIEWSDEFTLDYSTLKDLIDDVDDDSPEMDAADAVLKDCGCRPEDVYYRGTVDHRNSINGTKLVNSPAGYPGAITVEKIVDGRVTYYIMHGYEADSIFSVNK